MDKMLADFRAFCSNRNDRLTKYWKEFHKTLQKTDQTLSVTVEHDQVFLIESDKMEENNDESSDSWT